MDWEEYINTVKKVTKKQRVVEESKKVSFKKKNLDFKEIIDYQGLGYNKDTLVSDRKLQKRLKSKEIDRVLDLHFFTLEEAYKALYRFLINSRNDQCKTVLVITGKGHFIDGKYTGKIKNEAPKWLNYFQEQKIIGNFCLSNEEQGGEGAYIVTLKK
ncbi:MAG: Smr/MutS family protein [Sphingobacteriia bacterium]|nr:Smr/MutS family protein [Sphingobacteriia bacterium]